jgi:serine/threonine protein kinase
MSAPSDSPSVADTLSRPSAKPTDIACLRPAEAPGEMGRLGGFRILRELGRGGMGWVLLAEDLLVPRQVAMKVMRPDLASQPEYRVRFLREAQAAASLHDDHIVPIYQVGEDNGGLFFTMPLLPGRTLQERLADEQPAEIPLILQVGREVAAGLAAAHEHGLIHRDVKPANLWLETVAAGQRVKLLDFGLARPVDEPGHTHPGVILGTPGFMAPEQILGTGLDGRSDLFSLGCVLYRMATGNAPFKGPTTAASLCYTLQKEPPPPSSLRPDLPTGLGELIVRLLAKDPKDRPASAREVLETLRRIDGAETVPIARPTLGSSGRKWPILAGVLALGLGVVALVAFRTPGGESPSVPKNEILAPLKTHLSLRVGRKDAAGHGLNVADPIDETNRSLRKNDLVRMEASASRPAYLYLVYQQSDGKFLPMYPWQEYDWLKRGDEKPRNSLNLPENGFVPLDESPTGTEAILLLARDRPLDAEENLALMQAFKECEGNDAAPPLHGAARIDNDGVVKFVGEADHALRGKPNFAKPQEINDSVQRLRSVLTTSVRPLVQASYAVCYPFEKQ